MHIASGKNSRGHSGLHPLPEKVSLETRPKILSLLQWSSHSKGHAHQGKVVATEF
jgi:hypothetical protein